MRQALALALCALLSGCFATTVRSVDVEGQSCEQLRVIYKADKKEARPPG